MKGHYLGEFEELVLLVVASLGTEAYGVSVQAEVKRCSGRAPNISAVHSVLYRLEDKGFLKSRLGGATQKRGGKNKRYFDATNLGFRVLRESKNMRQQLWETIPLLSGSSA